MIVSLNNQLLQEYRFIDIFKFFCSFLIIGIHSKPFAEISMLDHAFGMLTRIAVPFFFISSSFFLFKKDFSWKRIAGYCKRMLLLYILYGFIYVIYELVTNTFAVNVFFIKFFVSGYQHLWFLHQGVIAVLIISAFTQVFKSPKLLYFFAAVIYVLGVAVFTFYPLIQWIEPVRWFHSSFISQILFERSWLFYAVPYMALGYYFANNRCPGKKISVAGIFVSYLFLAAESFFGVYFVHVPSTVLWISVAPLSFFVFSLVSNIRLKTSWKTETLRKSSTLIYCIHLIVIFVLQPLVLNNFLLFVITAVISFVYSIIVIKLSSLRHFRFLHFLY